MKRSRAVCVVHSNVPFAQSALVTAGVGLLSKSCAAGTAIHLQIEFLEQASHAFIIVALGKGVQYSLHTSPIFQRNILIGTGASGRRSGTSGSRGFTDSDVVSILRHSTLGGSIEHQFDHLCTGLETLHRGRFVHSRRSSNTSGSVDRTRCITRGVSADGRYSSGLCSGDFFALTRSSDGVKVQRREGGPSHDILQCSLFFFAQCVAQFHHSAQIQML